MARASYSIIDFYDIESPYVTEFRRLLHKIIMRKEAEELKAIMFTSAMQSEGKSTICSFLAITAAIKKGLKTLVIDADLRRPAIHKLFKLENKSGIHEILVEGFKPQDAICKTSIDKLDILPAGSFCENPSEVFDADAIGTLIEELKFFYDFIFVDTPPMLPVSDPMLLSSKMDGVILVVKAGETQKDVVRRAVAILDPQQSRILGVAMNNMSHSLPYYYDYGYYNYEYGPRRKQKTPKGGHAGKSPKHKHSRKSDNPSTPMSSKHK